MKHFSAVAFVLLAFVAIGQEEDWTHGSKVYKIGSGESALEYILVTNANGKLKKKFKPGEVKRRMYEYNGGFVTKEDSGKGSIAFVNCQTSFKTQDIADMAKRIELQFRLRTRLSDGKSVGVTTAGAAMLATGANAAIFVVDDPSLPPSLVAYDENWAICNVAKLHDGITKSIADERMKKSLLRTFLLLCGASDSGMYGTIMWPVKAPSDLDAMKLGEHFPPPLVQSVGNHMVRSGMLPVVVKTYRAACQEGWAHNPTNNVEKDIWEAVHAIPDKPMKVKFDPAAQKGKVTK